MSKLPYLPLFFGDFLASTYTWKGEQQALYLLLLGYQWVSGPLPADLQELAIAVRYEHKRFMALWEKVGTKFVLTDDGWINTRLEEHRDKATDISEKRSVAGAKGGRPKKQVADSLQEQRESKEKPIGFDLPNQAEKHPTQPNPIEEIPYGADAPAGTLKTQIFRLSKQLGIASGVVTNELRAHSEQDVWQALGSTLMAKPGDPLPYFRGILKPKTRGLVL